MSLVEFVYLPQARSYARFRSNFVIPSHWVRTACERFLYLSLDLLFPLAQCKSASNLSFFHIKATYVYLPFFLLLLCLSLLPALLLLLGGQVWNLLPRAFLSHQMDIVSDGIPYGHSSDG